MIHFLLGIIFKENCPDICNTKIVNIQHIFQEYTKNVSVFYSQANPSVVDNEYGISIIKEIPVDKKYDVAILLVQLTRI